MAAPHPPRIVRARRLRREETYAEAELWAVLRGSALGVMFRRQHPVGRFVADFACVERKLVVELDRAVHARPDVAEADAERTREIEACGWTVVRFGNDAVADMSGLLSAVSRAVMAAVRRNL